MMWHLLLILRYNTEIAYIEERKKCCLMFAVSHCCLLPSWDILEVPSSYLKAKCKYHNPDTRLQTKRCPSAQWTHVQVFIWMPFRRARSPSHMVWGDFEPHRLWIRLLPSLWRGGRILFILHMYSLKGFEKEGFDMFAFMPTFWTALKCKYKEIQVLAKRLCCNGNTTAPWTAFSEGRCKQAVFGQDIFLHAVLSSFITTQGFDPNYQRLGLIWRITLPCVIVTLCFPHQRDGQDTLKESDRSSVFIHLQCWNDHCSCTGYGWIKDSPSPTLSIR